MLRSMIKPSILINRSKQPNDGSSPVHAPRPLRVVWQGSQGDARLQHLPTSEASTSHTHEVKKPHKLIMRANLLPQLDYVKSGLAVATLPEEWDWRLQIGVDGLPLLLPTRDQGECGGCYSFAATQHLSHRLSIASEGRKRAVLSVQDIVSTGEEFISRTFENPGENITIQDLISTGKIQQAEDYLLSGCDGGLMTSVANYLVMRGVPSEADVPYIDRKDPDYTFGVSDQSGYYDRTDIRRYYASAAHSLVAGLEDGFSSTQETMPQDILESNVLNMKQALKIDGPFITGLNIFTDFYYYDGSGKIYRKQPSILVNGKSKKVVYEGAHAVTVVGWKNVTDTNGNSVACWICQNSWGTDWGMEGFFYIPLGINYCNIETDAIAVIPDMDSPMFPDGERQDSANIGVSSGDTANVIAARAREVARQRILFLSTLLLIAGTGIVACSWAAVYLERKGVSQRKKGRRTI